MRYHNLANTGLDLFTNAVAAFIKSSDCSMAEFHLAWVKRGKKKPNSRTLKLKQIKENIKYCSL